MPGLGIGMPELGFSSLLWLVVIVIAVALVWRGRTTHVRGTRIVLKRFRINEDVSAGPAVEISGRASGLVSWLLNLLRLESGVDLTVTESEVSIRSASLSGFAHTFIPLGKVSAAVCGYQRSIWALAFAFLFAFGFVVNLLAGFLGNRNEVGADMGLAFGFLVLAGVAALVYYLSKRIAIGVESMHSHGVVFKRSVVENVSIDLPEALRAVAAINRYLLAAQIVQTLTPGASASPGSGYARSSPWPAASDGHCPNCSASNPPNTRFCENCGYELSR